MRILVVDYAGHPFQYDLSTELGIRGHDVLHTYSSSTNTPQGTLLDTTNVKVIPVSIGRQFEHHSLARRMRDELTYGWRTRRVAQQFDPDCILTSNVPVLSLLLLYTVIAGKSCNWILWLQDIQSGLAALVMRKKGIAVRMFRSIEYLLIGRARHVVAISEAMRMELENSGIRRDHVTVIENWAPLEALPMRPRNNQWSDTHGLGDKFVFLYSGTLGVKHSPEMLKALADEFADDDDVVVLVVAEGVGADWLASQPTPRPQQLGFQPFEEVPNVLASADVLVALLDANAGAFSVPSKTLTYLCAGRPILAAIPRDNAAAEVIADRAKAGIVVDGGDVESFRKAARHLRQDHLARCRAGARARNYALSSFDRRAIADRFELLFDHGERRSRQTQ